MIAIPADYPPPEELPVEFYSYGACEIIDSESPGYVFLKLRYFVAECIDNGKYNAAPVNRDVSVSYTPGDDSNTVLRGPAQTFYGQGSASSYDNFVRCPLWSTQAADWPTRRRNSGWPDSATVDRVVSNVCDVVRVSHSLCRQDERARQ